MRQQDARQFPFSAGKGLIQGSARSGTVVEIRIASAESSPIDAAQYETVRALTDFGMRIAQHPDSRRLHGADNVQASGVRGGGAVGVVVVISQDSVHAERRIQSRQRAARLIQKQGAAVHEV